MYLYIPFRNYPVPSSKLLNVWLLCCCCFFLIQILFHTREYSFHLTYFTPTISIDFTSATTTMNKFKDCSHSFLDYYTEHWRLIVLSSLTLFSLLTSEIVFFLILLSLLVVPSLFFLNFWFLFFLIPKSEYFRRAIFLKNSIGEFPGGPVVRTQHFPLLRSWVQSLVMELRSSKLCGAAKNK